MVVQGDEVDPNGLEQRIENAKALLFGISDELRVAVAAVKCPDSDYRERIFRKAGIGDLSAKHEFELGWLFVVPKYRRKGFSTLLVNAAMEALGTSNSYATSKTTNFPMHRTLLKFGFFSAGKPWRSSRGPYDLAMYLKSAIQPPAAADAPRAARR